MCWKMLGAMLLHLAALLMYQEVGFPAASMGWPEGQGHESDVLVPANSCGEQRQLPTVSSLQAHNHGRVSSTDMDVAFKPCML